MMDESNWSAAQVEEAIYNTANELVRDAVQAYNTNEDARFVSGVHDTPEEAIRADAEVYDVEDVPPLVLIEHTPDVDVSDVPIGRQSSRDEVVRTLAFKSAAVEVRERALDIFDEEYEYDEQSDEYHRDPTIEL